MGSRIPPKLETLSLIDMCGWELDRLRYIASEYRAYNDVSRRFLEEAAALLDDGNASPASKGAPLQPAIAEYELATVNPDIKVCRDRAEEHRVFAGRASDPLVRKLLFEIAEGYDGIANAERPVAD